MTFDLNKSELATLRFAIGTAIESECDLIECYRTKRTPRGKVIPAESKEVTDKSKRTIKRLWAINRKLLGYKPVSERASR